MKSGGSKKSALVTRFSICDSSLCFVNCHLSSGKENYQSRLQDLRKIFTEAFQKEKLGKIKDIGLSFSDQIFVFGNLNFRVELLDNVVREKLAEYQQFLSAGDYISALSIIEDMLESDQLSNCLRDENNMLGTFQEGNIRFPPTYKLNIEDGNYIQHSNFTPSW